MRLLFFIFLFLIAIQGNTQETYSYVGERIIDDPTDLVGYNFRPFKMEVPGDYDPTMIKPGAYSFGITRSRLYVSGDMNIRGLYEINNIAPTIYGYKVTLLNPSNPNSRGHFKVILNKLKEVVSVVFKAESKSTEYIFHLPNLSKQELKSEQNYFTDLGELMVEDADSLWGTKIVPFFRVSLSDKIQNRLYQIDSTIISFEEVIRVKEKKKRRKRKKKKNVENDNDEKNPNQKIIKEYFVKVQSVLKYNDGTSETKTWEYPVRKIEEREDDTARKNEERYQIAFQMNKRQEVYLYLNKDRTVSSFEADGMKYLMRGH